MFLFNRLMDIIIIINKLFFFCSHNQLRNANKLYKVKEVLAYTFNV